MLLPFQSKVVSFPVLVNFCRWFCLCSLESDERRICWGGEFQFSNLVGDSFGIVLHSRFSLSVFVKGYGFSFLEGGVVCFY